MGDCDLATPETPILLDAWSAKLVSITLVTPPKPFVVSATVGSILATGTEGPTVVGAKAVRAVVVDGVVVVVKDGRENCNFGVIDKSRPVVSAVVVVVAAAVRVDDVVVGCRKLSPLVKPDVAEDVTAGVVDVPSPREVWLLCAVVVVSPKLKPDELVVVAAVVVVAGVKLNPSPRFDVC